MKSFATTRNSNLSLFGDETEVPSCRSLGVETHVDSRPIAQNPAPPPHQPTSAVPHSLLRSLCPSVLEVQEDTTVRTLVLLEEVLGSPYHKEPGFILFNRDCLEALRQLQGSRFRTQLTVTSPPYNIGKAYEAVRGLRDYVEWTVNWIKTVYGVTSSKGAFWLNLGYVPVGGKGKAVPIPYLMWDKTPFFLIQEIVWNYGAGVSARQSFSPRNEKWLFYTVNANQFTFNLDEVRDSRVKYPNQKKNGKYRCNPLGKNPSDVWQFPKVTTGTKRSSKERTPHPAQFPLGIVERIVRVSSNSGDVVLDPFSGSGSMAIAAVGTGRVFVGFEIREDYCRLSVERLGRFRRLRGEAIREPALFNSDADFSEPV